MEDEKQSGLVDELLDASLAQLRSEKPRPGLESRLVARVRAGELAARRRTWAWGLALSTAAALILTLTLHLPQRRPLPVPSTLPIAASKPAPAPFIARSKGLRATAQEIRRVKPGRPRPEQFPTPSPITGQEKLLLLYVQGAAKSAQTNQARESTEEVLEIPDLTVAALGIKELERPLD